MTSAQLVRGTLDLLILRALRWEPTHGHGVAEWIRMVTAGQIQLEEGTLYPALHRLERRGLVQSEWGRSERNRRARQYQLTLHGRQVFRAEAERWERYVEIVDRVLRYGTSAGIASR